MDEDGIVDKEKKIRENRTDEMKKREGVDPREGLKEKRRKGVFYPSIAETLDTPSPYTAIIRWLTNVSSH